MSNVQKYIQHYAELELSALAIFPSDHNYKNTVVIPAYNESDAFIKRFVDSKLSAQTVLVIVVINQPVSENDCRPQLKLMNDLEQIGQPIWSNKNLTLLGLNDCRSNILVIDRFSNLNAIPDKQGVGLARKTGTDIATYLIDKGVIESPWICTTDADTFLPNNYFSALTEVPPNTSAITFNFRHINHADSVSKATQRYEQTLRYYVSGLQWAGSSYAYHCIGSTLALRYDHYAMARGFPKRAAGEDFYLLNKMNKLAPVRILEEVIVRIDSRRSNRTPFGTGPAVSKILALADIDDYQSYNPQVFVELKSCLAALNELWNHRDNLEHWMVNLSSATQYALHQLPIQKLLQHIEKQQLDEDQCRRHIFQWFDAFRTLKFIHYLQAAHYPKIPFKQAITESSFHDNYLSMH